MRENFARSLELVLKHEGGWADHPKDPGGATMKGITIATFRAYLGRENVTKTELRNISDQMVAAIYRKNYWDKVNGDALPHGLDYAVFDFGVNSGPGRAVEMLQGIVGAKQDGVVGPATMLAINGYGVAKAIRELCARRLSWLRTLGTFATFGRGWSARVTRVEVDALKMVGLVPDPAPIPPPPDVPRITPAPPPAPKPRGLWALILALLSRIFGGRNG